MTEDAFPTEIYWVTGGGRPRLYASAKAVKLAIPNRRYASGYGHIKVWKFYADRWADYTQAFITEEGRLAW